jgi:hypothetical protein
VLPEDAVDLERADNAVLVLTPEGAAASFEVDGTAFALEIEVEPDEANRTIELYLARGGDLLAWGRSAAFVTKAPTDALAMFIGRPGALSTFPGAIDTPDAAVLGAEASGRGLVLLGSEGATFLFSSFTLEAEAGATLDLEGNPLDPYDGALVSDSVGGVIRLVWNQSLAAYRYDPGLDSWSTLEFSASLAGRSGAAHLQDSARERVLLFGGGEATDIVEIDLLAADDGTFQVRTLADVVLSGPRVGARARWITRADSDEGEGIVLAGTTVALANSRGEQPRASTPVLEFIPSDADASPFTAGPEGSWHAIDCLPLEIGANAGPEVTLRVLCGGGVRADAPTADGLLVAISPGAWSADSVTVEEVPGLLIEPMAAPLWLADDSALYAQSDGSWVTIARESLEADLGTTSALRARGGHSVKLSTGATFLLGGEDEDGHAVDRWQVFTPSVTSG